MKLKHFSLTYTQIIALGFFLLIMLGAFLLMLPLSSRSGAWTSFSDAAFTATSATCVTGLVVKDTYTYWSSFGHGVILALIQIGGIGFMTIITLFSLFFKRQISLRERKLIMQASGSLGMNGISDLVRRIVIGTLIFESLGTLLLAIRFCPDMGILQGLRYAFFHSVSAFCNAGFDLMGKNSQFSSFTAYTGDILVNITIMALIIIGGIGFIVWSDVVKYKHHIARYQLHSKIVLAVTASLIFGGAFMFFVLEYSHGFADLPLGDKIIASFFQSVSPRTAGMATVSLINLSESGILLTVLLMFIGGNPGSTAGGIKTTTFIVLILSMLASAKRNNDIVIMKRRLENDIIRQSASIAIFYVSMIIICTLLICAEDPVTLKQALFETVSAAGTVGLSLDLTPTLSLASRYILMVLMFAGRVGGLSLALILGEKRAGTAAERPLGNILVG